MSHALCLKEEQHRNSLRDYLVDLILRTCDTAETGGRQASESMIQADKEEAHCRISALARSLDWLEHLQVSPMAGGWNLAFISAKDPTSGSPAKRIRCWSLAVMNPIYSGGEELVLPRTASVAADVFNLASEGKGLTSLHHWVTGFWGS